MFDIGFSELLLIAIVALIVIGPERLPTVARTLGHLLGRMQRYVNDVKADISREMELEELKKLQSSMEDAARSLGQSVEKGLSETESDLNQLAQSAQPTADSFPEPSPAPAPVEPAAKPASPQLELGLDAASQSPAQKQL